MTNKNTSRVITDLTSLKHNYVFDEHGWLLAIEM